MPKGLLIALMEPPAEMEGEFNDWYDTEHFPDRVACPGFESCARFVCVSGWPRYGALYDLTSTSVLQSEAYKAIMPTPWTKRVFARALGFTRVAATQVAPGDALAPTDIARLLIARHPKGNAAALMKACGAVVGLSQARVFANDGDPSELWLTATFSRVVSPDALLGTLGSVEGASLFNLYTPYRRG